MDFLNTAEKRDRRMVHLPMGRFGEAVEIAQAACFRASSFPCSTSLRVSPLAPRSRQQREQLHHRTSHPSRSRAVSLNPSLQGTDFKVDGGLTSCYVTPLGEPALAPPTSLVPPQ